MKIIGRTEEGARIVEISPAEITTINWATETLINLSTVLLPACLVDPGFAKGSAEASPEPPITETTERTCRAGNARVTLPAVTTRQRCGRKLPADRVDRHKTCEICGKAFVDKSRTNSRKLCKKKSCKHEQKKKYQRNWLQEKKQSKQTKEPAIVPTATNPADPSLTDAQRNALKAKRLSIIQTLSEKHKHDDAT